MSTNKFFLWIAVSLISGAVCAVSALAETHRPEAYQTLRDVPLAPAVSPRLNGGMGKLSDFETLYSEPLPVQLQGAIKRVESRKYVPTRKSRTIHF